MNFSLRKDTAKNWESNDPVLSEDEVGLDLTNDVLRQGDGSTAWSKLPLMTGSRVPKDLTHLKELVPGQRVTYTSRLTALGKLKALRAEEHAPA